ncbi:hypothetical protein L7F22_043011 [Adiantum nelumboides]|nr:hypothetical protein [Adiantum nelumboides]
METIIPCPSNQNLTRQDNPGSQTAARDESREPRPFSVRHVYAKSLGGDETNEFYDALSRFVSQSSTPSRILSGGSMSRDWGPSDDFLDATSTPFESPRTSVSEFWFSGSPAIASKSGSSNRPTSKLSKRVGKTLWVDTGEVHATGKASDLRSAPVKTFYSGELFATTSTASSSALNKEEPLSTRRKWVSGDQASTSQARRQNKRGISCPQIGKNSIAVTPVFHSKCQKNRMIASASGLPCPMLAEDMKDVGWPLGISGYPPPSKKCGKEKAESKHEVGCSSSGSSAVPLPPLPAAPAGGSWLRKALTSNTLNQAPSRLAGLQAPVEKTPSSPSANSPNNKWEDIVKGSHVQPGHLRFSEELHHQPPKSSSNKYFVS